MAPPLPQTSSSNVRRHPPPATRSSNATRSPAPRNPAKALPLRTATPTRSATPTSKATRSASQAHPPPVALQEEDGVILLTPRGDIVLSIVHTLSPTTTETLAFRVSSTSLTSYSSYFARLLDPSGAFAEGARVATELALLGERYQDIWSAPVAELPRVKVEDVGMISRVASVRGLMGDFLGVLHGLREVGRVGNARPISIEEAGNGDAKVRGMAGEAGGATISRKVGAVKEIYPASTTTNVKPTKPAAVKMPMKNLANLSIVADRFGATDCIGHWVSTNVSLTGGTTSNDLSEEQIRMRLLIGVLLSLDRWTSTWSLQLLLNGSSKWSGQDGDVEEPLWWHIPRFVEEELQTRRTFILRTIASLQSHLLGLFASRNRQCRLGYDSSPTCDSFQLGEFVKFLSRIGTLQLLPSFATPEDDDDLPIEFTGDLRVLIATLKTCSSYQVDANHAHCGPKKGLLAGLDFLERLLTDAGAGLCWRCWTAVPHDGEQRWTFAKRPLRFDRKLAGRGGFLGSSTSNATQDQQGRCPKAAEHTYARESFLAKDKAWEEILEMAPGGGSVATRLSNQGWVLKHPDLLQQQMMRAGV